MATCYLENPQENRWWEAHLRWMMEYGTEDLCEMWNDNPNRLIDYLESRVKQATEMEIAGEEEYVIAAMLCPEEGEELEDKADMLELDDPQEWLENIREEMETVIYPWAMDPKRMEGREPLELEIPNRKPRKRAVKETLIDDVEIPRTGSMEDLFRKMNGK